MFPRLSKVLAIFVAVQLLGGYWFALQCAAWVGMFAHYSHDGNLTVAVEKTFDGQHPCDLCRALTKARDTEKKQERVVSMNKIEMIHQIAAPLFFSPRLEETSRVMDIFAVQSFVEPATPPPRLA